MRVKIIKCSLSTYWYSECIGQEFEVYEKKPHAMNNFQVYNLKHDPIYFIRASDVIEVVKSEQVLTTPINTLEWLQARQDELQNYVIQCMENGDEIDKRVTKEYYVNQKRIAEITNV